MPSNCTTLWNWINESTRGRATCLVRHLSSFQAASVFQARPSTQACSRKAAAFLPGAAFHSWGSALILGTRNRCQVSHVSLVLLWQRGAHSSGLERLRPTLELCPWNRDSVHIPGFSAPAHYRPLRGMGLFRGQAFRAGSCAIFQNPLHRAGKQHWLPLTGSRWIFNTGVLFEKLISFIVKS